MAKKSRDAFTWISTTAQAPWKDMSRAAGKTPGPAATMDLALSGSRHQKIEGFGGCFNELGWIALSALPAASRDKVFASLFDPREGCRFNICRLPIGASDYAAQWYSLNESQGDFGMKQFSIERDRHYLIPYVQQALKRRADLKLFASPWSPPTWMKYPQAHNYGTLIWTKENLQAYALYFVKYVQAYRRQGIRIDQIHVQNEPVADQKFPSCRWTGRQLRDFIRDYLGPIFEQNKIDAEIWLGTLNTGDFEGFVQTALGDPRARQYIAGVGVQWDGKHLIQRTNESYPDLRTMQTENECGEGQNSWEYAGHVFNLLRHYFDNGVRAYVYWNMVLPPGGRSTWGWLQNAMITVDPQTKKVHWNHEFYVMKHFARFVEPGAVRLGLSGPWTGDALAFENADGRIVLAVRNPFDHPRGLKFEAAGKTHKLTLPADSINTIVL